MGRSLNAAWIGQGPRFAHVVFQRRARHGRSVDFAMTGRAPLPPQIPAIPPDPLMSPTEICFLRWLFERASLNIRSYRPETLYRRLAACLRALRVASIPEARNLLARDPAKVSVAIGALVIGVTSFFRDTAVFSDLASVVIPALPRLPQPRRIWSIGCSDGAEVYSVAMLLAEAQRLAGSEIFATDCRGPAIERTRSGLYDERDLSHIPAAYRERYLCPDGNSWRVISALRGVVKTRVADITRFDEPGLFDLILCRNMAMYLRAKVAASLWTQLEQSLRSGGFLVLGKAERPIGATRLSQVAPCIYRRN